jgi:hypothetical protein
MYNTHIDDQIGSHEIHKPVEDIVERSPNGLEVGKQITTERHSTHGPFFLVAKISQGLKHYVKFYGDDLTKVQWEALDMIFMKISRILAGNNNYKDHWVDIIGYTKLALDEINGTEF